MNPWVDARLLHVAAAPFEAARELPALPRGHPSRRLHGHSFMATVRARAPQGGGPLSGTETEALEAQLSACIAALDYRALNEVLPDPTDDHIARWIRERLGGAGVETVGVQSTRHQGVDLDDDGRARVWRRFRFEAAHRLPHVPAGHPCGRMHGHGFEVVLHADRAPAGRERAVDHARLGELWRPLHEQLHQVCLNDIPGLENPTSELLARWIWERLKPRFTPLSWVGVHETATAGCHFDGTRYRIWKAQSFEAALRLPRAPARDRRRALHGHSYAVRLHLSAPLDDLLGWTVDYGDVKARFRPVQDRLDHHTVNAVAGVDEGGAAGIAAWIGAEMTGALPELDRVDVEEKPGCGVLLCREGAGPILPV